ncbi:MAG TPA: hypothetical protein VK922_11670 [Gemmatimonadaceae bacterium]|nr:hypothetical protein [Gemmatimonadaceae bacterium]
MSGSFKVIRSSTKSETEVSRRAKRAIVATRQERREPLPGDDIVPLPRSSYTLAVTIGAARSEIWPWLVQMGQGRGGFYTHVWVERLLGAEIENADEILPDLQRLAIGDVVRLTPDPYRGHPGQYMTVAHLKPRRSLVFSQTLPNGARATWAFVLRTAGVATTRLLLRRRSERPTWFDRVLHPGYLMMDAGVLRGLRKRAEAGARRARLTRVGLPVMRRRDEGDVRRP